MTQSNPVLIVGAGPTGLALAIECCRHKIPFHLIDQNTKPSPYSKALGIWHGTLQMLQAQSLLTDFMKASMVVRCVSFADKGRVLGAIYPSQHPLAGLQAPVVLPQSTSESLLTQHLSKLGGSIERGVTLIEFKETETEILATLQHQDGQTEVFHAAYLAGCDGARSVARKTLEASHEAQFTGYTETATYVLADVEYDGTYENDQIMISWGKHGALALFPVSPTVLRIVSERKNDSNAEPTLTEIQNIMDDAGPQGLKLKNPSWLSLFRINERLSRHYQKGRVFLLGDAAHIHSPAGGQGMNTSMQDAYNLGWKLAFLMQNKGTQTLAKSYEKERRPIAKDVIKEASQKLHFGMMQNPIMRAIKDLILPVATRIKPFQHKMISELSELFIEYDNSPLISKNIGLPELLQPGKKWSDATLLDPKGKEASMFALTFNTKHTLVKFVQNQAEWDLFISTIKPYQEQLDFNLIGISKDILPKFYTCKEPQLAHLKESLSRSIWYLIRPDQFIAAGGADTDMRGLEHYCKALS